MSEATEIITQYQGNVLEIILNRPHKRHALTRSMLQAIIDVIQSVQDQSTTSGIVIKSTGPIFCAGADLVEMQTHSNEMIALLVQLIEVFSNNTKPLLVVLEGDVYAGALIFLNYAHVVYALDHVKVCLPEVNKGLMPYLVMAELRSQISLKKMYHMVLMGEAVSVQSAEIQGLISKIFSSQQDCHQAQKKWSEQVKHHCQNISDFIQLVSTLKTPSDASIQRCANALKMNLTSECTQNQLKKFKRIDE